VISTSPRLRYDELPAPWPAVRKQLIAAVEQALAQLDA
jgi:hypothetical protein